MLLACAAGWASLQQEHAPPAAASEAAPVLTGPQLFAERGCSHCHTIQGEGGHKGPDLSSIGRQATVAELRRQIVEGGGAMPAFGEVLPEPEVDALVVYLQHCRAGKGKVQRRRAVPGGGTAPATR